MIADKHGRVEELRELGLTEDEIMYELLMTVILGLSALRFFIVKHIFSKRLRCYKIF